MDYKIAIPSLKRSNLLLVKTYKFLNKHNIPDNKIYIFVIDNEFEIYKLIFPNCNIVVGRFTAKNNKNYILDYFPKNTFILQLDDDIKDIYMAIDKKTLTPLQDLDKFILEGIETLKKTNCNIYGVYPIKNPGFMFGNKEAISQKLNYCCGAVLLMHNHHLVQRSLNLIEDFEFSLKNYLHNNKILRNNRICVEANQYTASGGLQYNNNRNIQNKLIEIKKLKNQYPEYIKINMKSKNQVDIRFQVPKQKKIPELTQNIETNQEVDEVNELNTFYTGDSQIPKYYLMCINSWLNLKYKVNIHSNIDISNLPPNVKCIKTETNKELAPAQQADLFRYEYLLNNPNQIWIDLDMYLVRRLPKQDYIISSEQPNRKGGYKSDKPYTPNIGVLKLADTSILKETLKKCKAIQARKGVPAHSSNGKNKDKLTCYMKIFINLLSKYDLDKYVSEWRVFCPLDWSNVKEAFNGQPLKSKFGKEVIEVEEIKNNKDIIGVHLWGSFIKKHNIQEHSTNSFIAFLC
jgi:hypothetical protein